MQRGRGGRNDFFDFGDPFAGFGGFEGHRSIMSSFLGGRDPFDDPFFIRPFGSMGSSMLGPGMLGPGMLGPGMLGPGMLGPSMLGPSVFGHGMSGNRGSFIGDSASSGVIENRICEPNKSKGIVIEELNSDEEEEDKAKKEKGTNSRKHHRPNKEPFVEEPDNEMEERKNKHTQLRNEYYRADRAQPQTHTVSFQSSTVTYGGVNGAYYTSSKTRRTGGDGVIVEENKEADTTTGKAAHRIARGIHDKGHSITRKLNSDGRVDTLQTLHNLNEDELDGFEDTWKVNARKHLPGWEQQLSMNGPMDVGAGSSNMQSGQPSRGWALPSTERAAANGDARVNSFEGRAQANKRANGEMKPKSFNA